MTGKLIYYLIAAPWSIHQQISLSSGVVFVLLFCGIVLVITTPCIILFFFFIISPGVSYFTPLGATAFYKRHNLKFCFVNWFNGTGTDTCYFKENYPGSCMIEGCVKDAGTDFATTMIVWQTILPQTKLQADHEHYSWT